MSLTTRVQALAMSKRSRRPALPQVSFVAPLAHKVYFGCLPTATLSPQRMVTVRFPRSAAAQPQTFGKSQQANGTSESRGLWVCSSHGQCRQKLEGVRAGYIPFLLSF